MNVFWEIKKKKKKAKDLMKQPKYQPESLLQ